MKTKEIHDDMDKTLDENFPCCSPLKKLIADFKRDRESIDDDARTGRSKSATIDAQVEGIHCLVMNGRCVTVKHSRDSGPGRFILL